MQVQEMYAVCTNALKSYVQDAGFTDVVIGLSGGIDSALVAVMCVDAFGADQVHGVVLPGPYSSTQSVDDAEELAGNLGIDLQTMSICKAFKAFDQAFEGANGKALEGLAAENTQARCRMICLMALSNTFGWLLINTGNKSEAMMGYSTLYGDAAGAFAPLGGIYKSSVFALAKWRNAEGEDRGKGVPIPRKILTKAPSAELAPAQNDERAMGISYARLDPLLISLVEEGKSAVDVIARGFPEEEVLRINAIIRATEFKRKLSPPFPDAAFYQQ